LERKKWILLERKPLVAAAEICRERLEFIFIEKSALLNQRTRNIEDYA